MRRLKWENAEKGEGLLCLSEEFGVPRLSKQKPHFASEVRNFRHCDWKNKSLAISFTLWVMIFYTNVLFLWQ